MIKALLYVRFRGLLAGITAQARRKKSSGKGTIVLYAFLFLYLGVVLCGAVGFMFSGLAPVYSALGLDWLYFALAGLMALAFSLIGSVFTTQSQLYDAKDNDLLLSMPIPPRQILLSRMLPLLLLTTLYAGALFIPAMVVYAWKVALSPLSIVLQILGLVCVILLSQGLACLLGWPLHLLLKKLNKSVASMLYLVVFLGVYFWGYSQSSELLSALAAQGDALAGTFRTWVWPLYALGQGCVGAWPYMLATIGIAVVVFAGVYALLSATFLSTTLSGSRRKRRRAAAQMPARVHSPRGAIVLKEWRKFLGCPVYLTNMGLGIVLTVALTVAGLIFRGKLLEISVLLENWVGLIVCGLLAFLSSTMCISTPSVSLEGKNLWIVKSMPISSRDILLGKLAFHCLLSAPVLMVAGAVLSTAYGCKVFDILLCVLVPGLLAVLCGLLGLICGLKWARFDYLSDAYPCKQSVSVLVTMLTMMYLPLGLGLVYALTPLRQVLSVSAFLALGGLVVGGLCLAAWRALTTWGVRKWDSL